MKDKSKWFGIVYVLTNLVNGKQYVGKSEKHERRWDEHIALTRGKSQQYIHRAIRKYGVSNFSAEVLQRCRTLQTLNAAETRWIKKLDTLANGYNMTAGGDGVSGYKPTKAVSKKRSKSLLLHWADAANYDRHVAVLRSPEVKASMSRGQKKRFAEMTDEERLKISKQLSKAQLKRYAKPGALRVMREAQARRFADEEKRAANAAAHQTPKYRKLQSKNSKALWEDPAWRKRALATKATPAYKRKASRMAKEWHADPVKHANILAGYTPKVRKQMSKSIQAWYDEPVNRAQFTARCRTPEFRARKKKDTKKFWASMTPKQRSAYWKRIHPNGLTKKSKR